MNHPETVTALAAIESLPERLKTERLYSFAKRVNSTPNTVYRWLREGNMYCQFLNNGEIAVFRRVK